MRYNINGAWGTVCDYNWDQRDAIVVCRQLGYPYGELEIFYNSYFGEGTGEVWMSDVRCTGTEERLSDCAHDGWGETSSSCDDHGDDVGVRCKDGRYLENENRSLPDFVV